jgi:hypothetical protein
MENVNFYHVAHLYTAVKMADQKFWWGIPEVPIGEVRFAQRI